MSFNSFNTKWSKIKNNQTIDEKSLFVDVGNEPITQRQLNLYYYFLFIKNILNGKVTNVLEVGCGRGTISLYLAKHLGLNVSLLDNESGAIDLAKTEFVKHGQSAQFYVADVLQTGIARQSFDAITSIGLAEHFKEEEIENLFKEQYDLLRPGGVMISLNIPKKSSIQFLNTTMRFIKKIFGQYKESVSKDYYRNSFKPEDYQRIAKKVGFKNISIVNVCPFPIYTPIKMSTDKNITKINKLVLKIRGVFQKFPYKTNYLFSQAHFLVAYKSKDQASRAKKILGHDQEVFVIAEIGKNFIQTEEEKTREEYLANAKALILAAKESGADAVKFQTHNVEDEQLNIEIVSPHFSGSDRYNWVKRNNEITTIEFWQELKRYCDELEIIFFSTPMSRGAAKILEENVDVPLWKVGSGDILDFVTLDYMASTGKPIIVSSGMSTLEEIDLAIKFLKARTDKTILLHCVSKYPCPPEELNLNTIKLLKDRYDLPTGFSDHSIGYDSAIAAVNMGAVVIEKHFSFSRDFWGSDHKVSMLPEEFKTMIDKIRNKVVVDLKDYGQEKKILHGDEEIFRPIFRKSLMAGADIKAGTILTKDMIYAMRPQKYANGLPSEEYETVLNKKLKKDLKKHDPINLEIIE